MFPQGEWGHGGVILSDGVVDAGVLELTETILLIDLDYRQWSCEFVVAPEVLDHEVRDGYGFGSTCNSNAPLSGL